MNLFIYGSGGLGCEISDIADKINEHQTTWQRVHFVDDIREESVWHGRQVYRFDQMLAEEEEFACVIAQGEPLHRRALYEKLLAHGVTLATIIDPSAEIAKSAKIGQGCIVGPHCFISCNTRLEDNSMLEVHTIVGHDIHVGRHTVISSCSVIGGETRVGDDSFIGLNCTIKEKLHIGNHCIVGMGSSVFNDIPDGYIALGNPARPVRLNEDRKVFKERLNTRETN